MFISFLTIFFCTHHVFRESQPAIDPEKRKLFTYQNELRQLSEEPFLTGNEPDPTQV